MLQSQPFLYSGKDWIDRYYGENQEDNEDFQEVLEMADEAKNKMIQGVLKYMESEGIEIELDKVNRLMGRFASKILQLYISFV
jgi:DNA polymerase I-like protein with 3'-5' exonuclease and polymerase domains